MKKILVGLLIAFLMSILITPIALANENRQDPPDLRQRIFIHYARGNPGPPPGKGGGKTGISLKWVNPKDGDAVSGAITVQIEASDKDGSITVEWKVNTEDYKDITTEYNLETGYYEDDWNTKAYSEGDHKLTAKATDNDGNTKEEVITVTVSNEEKGYLRLMGVKWNDMPVKIEVNPSNPNGLPEADVVDLVGTSAEEWDDGACSGWGGVPPNLFDDEIATTTKTYDDLAWRSSDLDGANTIVWGNYRRPRVIAVTIIWYNSITMEIVEFDMVLDTDFDWSLDAPAEKGKQMDLQNIVTHELGHGAGLDDLTQDAAYQETMYGYADYDETIKRDLYIGDKMGITELYG